MEKNVNNNKDNKEDDNLISNDIIESQITESLKEIIDPELHINIVDLGLVYEINIYKNNKTNKKDNYNIDIIYTLTTPNCPIAPYIEKEILEVVDISFNKNFPDIKYDLDLQLTFSPPWTSEMMSEEAKFEILGEVIF